ncbi:Snf7-domain-containing protein [Mycena floridula]|nr:Snf7-domain-containing protein [Mycena floridula]
MTSGLPVSLMNLAPVAAASSSRLQSLYSDFSRQKQSNPASYNANVEWWRRTLESFVQSGLQTSGSRLVLGADRTLVNSLRVEGVGKPIGLGAVITELLGSNSAVPSLFPLSAFLAVPSSIYASSSWRIPSAIANYVLVKPLWWMLEQVGAVGEEGILTSSSSSKWHGDYVVTSLVEQAAEAVLLQQSDTGESLYTYEGFRKEFANCVQGDLMTVLDAKVLLRHLERDKAAVRVDVSKNIIKFTTASAEAISAVDVGILELRTAVKNLHHQIEGIQNRIEMCTSKASTALNQTRSKPIAISYLKSRKQLEELLGKRLGSLATLEGTLIAVEAAAEDIEIISTFQSSTATLKKILAHPSLQRDEIDRTMDALADANADAKEVDDAVRLGADAALEIDDTDINEQLEALILEEESNTRDKLDALPAVPTREASQPIQDDTRREVEASLA